MKRLLVMVCLITSWAMSFPVAAQDPDPQVGASLSTLVKYFAHLGQYFGFNLEKSPQGNVSSEFLEIGLLNKLGAFAMTSILQAMPVNTMGDDLKNFLPMKWPDASNFNGYANATFNAQLDKGTGGGSGALSITTIIDQNREQPPIQDPVTQAVWNILVLGTPNLATICKNTATPNAKCQFKDQGVVLSNLLGELPKDLPQGFLDKNYTQRFMAELNGNSLIAPLMYSTEVGGSSTGSPLPEKENQGLTAQSQAQQVANFVRYVSGAVNPITLLERPEYTKMFLLLSKEGLDPASPDGLEQQRQKRIFQSYLANLRTYAAQSSIGYSNLYFILSKRLPQGADATAPSQAKTEFDMATRRLYVPAPATGGPAVKQWVDKINEASSTTIQKEIAMLLAEMNYQLYLNRQMQERILLTNTVMLMQNTVGVAPKLELMNEEATVPP